MSTSPESLPPLRRSPLAWLALFGPGAIVASVTIGTGELIFSSRGGALFGYDILFLFVVISFLKWGMVVGMARHIVLSGIHPFQRFLHLPGPRGWLLVLILFVLAICMPIWVSFHSSVIGNLTSWMTGTSAGTGGRSDYLWGAGILSIVWLITSLGGYSVLERVQLFIVAALLLCAGITLLIYGPDWIAMIRGAFLPTMLAYPDWINETTHPKIAGQPIWVETTRYVGVIGGAAFDYLAYTSWLRDKKWGYAGGPPATDRDLLEMAERPDHPVRLWLRAPVVDCTISFLLVIGFSAVFVAAGAMFLGPHHKVPDDVNMLSLQSEFVTNLHPWLLPLYACGAFLTMLGTLYGTIEIANATFRELAYSASPGGTIRNQAVLKRASTTWCVLGAYLILIWMFVHELTGGHDKPRILMDVLTPANLFTGVFSCGYVCLLLPWIDRKFLPHQLRMPKWLAGLNVFSGVIFLTLGIKGYWDHEVRWVLIGSLCSFWVLSLIVASIIGPISKRRSKRRQIPA